MKISMPDGGSPSIQDLLTQLLQSLQNYGSDGTSSTVSTATPAPPSSEQTWFAPASILDHSATSGTANPKSPRPIPTGSSRVGSPFGISPSGIDSFRKGIQFGTGANGPNANFGEGGGAWGQAKAEQIRGQSGYAPATLAGMMAAGSNLVKGVFGVTNPMGLASLGLSATGATPKGLLGHIFNSGMQPIPGQTPFDSDILSRISPSYTMADAVRDQAARNNARGIQAGVDAARNAIAAGQGMHVGHPGGGGGGGGGGSAGDRAAAGGADNKGNFGGGGFGGHPGV